MLFVVLLVVQYNIESISSIFLDEFTVLNDFFECLSNYELKNRS